MSNEAIANVFISNVHFLRKAKDRTTLKQHVQNALAKGGFKHSFVMETDSKNVFLIGIIPNEFVDESVGSPLCNMLTSILDKAVPSLIALKFDTYEYSVEDINDAAFYGVLFNDVLHKSSNDLEKFRLDVLKKIELKKY